MPSETQKEDTLLRKKEKLESAYGRIRECKKQIEQFEQIIKKLKSNDPSNRNIPLYQRDILDLKNEIEQKMNEIQGKSEKNNKNNNTFGGVWLHINDVINYLGLLDSFGFDNNHQEMKRILKLINETELKFNPYAKERIDYFKKKILYLI